jgi:hypothetical protein
MICKIPMPFLVTFAVGAVLGAAPGFCGPMPHEALMQQVTLEEWQAGSERWHRALLGGLTLGAALSSVVGSILYFLSTSICSPRASAKSRDREESS